MIAAASPGLSASTSAQSGATGGTSGATTTGAFNVTKGPPAWVWFAAAAGAAAAVLLLWRPSTKK